MSAQAIWCQVLLQALTDAFRAIPACARIDGVSDAMNERDYVLVPNPDFDLVCQLAGVEPEAVRRVFRARISRMDHLAVPRSWSEITARPRPASKPQQVFTCQGHSLTLRE